MMTRFQDPTREHSLSSSKPEDPFKSSKVLVNTLSQRRRMFWSKRSL